MITYVERFNELENYKYSNHNQKNKPKFRKEFEAKVEELKKKFHEALEANEK